MKTRIPGSAALIIYSNDEDMLRLQFESGQFDYYDHIYIFDGPYSYINNILPFSLESSAKLSNKPSWESILNDDRVSYSYQIYKDEYEKRTSAYKSIAEELIFLHDTDEFYEFDEASLVRFINSDAVVGGFSCQNLFNDGVCANLIEPTSSESFPLKSFAFKKKYINEFDHINYLWLVGVEQKPKNIECMFGNPLASGYHLTQMRSTYGQMQKYSFYSSLHATQNPLSDFSKTVINDLTDAVNQGEVESNVALYTYLSSIQHFSGVPNYYDKFILSKRIQFSENLECILSVANHKRHKSKSGNIKIYQGLSFYFYLNAERLKKIQILNPAKIDFKVDIYEYRLGFAGAKKINTAEKQTKDYSYDFTSEAATHGFLLEIISRDIRQKNIMDLDLVFEYESE